jgi:hypothetical protein
LAQVAMKPVTRPSTWTRQGVGTKLGTVECPRPPHAPTSRGPFPAHAARIPAHIRNELSQARRLRFSFAQGFGA